MVTLQIIRMLEDNYEIHLIPFDKVDLSKVSYKLPSKMIIEDIEFDKEISQFDINFKKHIKNKEFVKGIKLLFNAFNTYIFKRFKIRKKLESISSNEDIFIFASSELLLFAPKNRYVVQHFHFNSKLYNDFFSKCIRVIARKPDYYIFLTESTKKVIDKDNKLNSCVIPNPSRFKRKENFEYHNNSLISVLRFEPQKNPLFLLKIAKELDNMNFSYKLNLYGNGSMKNKMEEFIKSNNLKNVNLISGITELEPYYLKSDLYLITSNFEGFPLTVIEANTLSIPVIWKEMGDPTDSIMHDDINGYVLDGNDPKIYAKKIIEVLSNLDELKKLKNKTYIYSSIYEEDQIKEKRLKLFEYLFNTNF